MNRNYRGDTFWRSYEVEYEDKPYKFQEGDVLKVAFYDFANNEYLLKEIVVDSEKEQIDIYAPVCKNFYYAFYNCDKLKNIKLKSDVPVTSMGYCFGSSENLVSVDI